MASLFVSPLFAAMVTSAASAAGGPLLTCAVNAAVRYAGTLGSTPSITAVTSAVAMQGPRTGNTAPKDLEHEASIVMADSAEEDICVVSLAATAGTREERARYYWEQVTAWTTESDGHLAAQKTLAVPMVDLLDDHSLAEWRRVLRIHAAHGYTLAVDAHFVRVS
jgi:hypothetical protein